MFVRSSFLRSFVPSFLRRRSLLFVVVHSIVCSFVRSLSFVRCRSFVRLVFRGFVRCLVVRGFVCWLGGSSGVGGCAFNAFIHSLTHSFVCRRSLFVGCSLSWLLSLVVVFCWLLWLVLMFGWGFGVVVVVVGGGGGGGVWLLLWTLLTGLHPS